MDTRDYATTWVRWQPEAPLGQRWQLVGRKELHSAGNIDVLASAGSADELDAHALKKSNKVLDGSARHKL